MKKLSVLLCIFLLSACAPSEVPSDKLLERNGIKYEINSQIPFSGVSTDYYENGQLRGKETYKDGVKNGLSEEYYEDGQLAAFLGYKDGERNGPTENYYETGQLMHKSYYKDGKDYGLMVSYFQNGQLMHKRAYKDGVKNGISEEYDYHGQEKDPPVCYQNDKEVDMSKCK